MSTLRAILVLALVVHPLLLRALPCGPLLAPETAPACCEAACCCATGCACTLEAPALPDSPVPAPATPPGGGDLRASLPALTPLLTIVPASPPPPVRRPAGETRPFFSCASVNALHCIWTT